jgi:hypothetical protein
MQDFPAEELESLIRSFGEKYGIGKPWKILASIHARWTQNPSLRTIDRSELIKEVWREELKALKPSERQARIKALRNAFGTHKQIINTHLREMYGSGENPWRIGLVRGDVFGVFGGADTKPDLRAYAREIRSPWIIEESVFRIEIKDSQGRVAHITKQELLVPVVPNLREFKHWVSSDGPVSEFQAEPGWIADCYLESGRMTVVQRFGQSLSRDEPRQLQLTYVAKESFMNKQEYFNYWVHYPTARVRLEVKFPSDRLCNNASVVRFIGLEPIEEEAKPILTEGRNELSWEIHNPPHRERYKLIWEW